MSYETLQEAITRWAAAEPNVRALLLIGSRARIDHPADDWSDLDLILFVTDPQIYVNNTAWLESFGQVWLRVLNFTGAGDAEWMVIFAGGFKVDFILTSTSELQSDRLLKFSYAKVARRGVRVLLDKGSAESARVFSPVVADEVWIRPTFDEFVALLHRFWLSIYRASCIEQRGELWRARSILDGQVRQQILQMLEWRAKARQGDAYDTWYEGRFLGEWVEPQLLDELVGIFAPFNQEATRKAMIASLSLMDRLGRDTAELWGYPYPLPRHTQIQDWITAALKAGLVR